MRMSHLAIFAVVLMAACAHYVGTSSPTVARWEARNRDISELIAAIGPYDTTSIRGESRTYNWFRFGNCRLTAHTALDDKIQKIELEGMGQGCNVYLQKLGGA
ncbi:MAG TPA: hypothetical protein VGR65_11405 [Casimicrobiaceae bacterium]|nr:hypothetical protein [Casimicrobiaceae bacterium]